MRALNERVRGRFFALLFMVLVVLVSEIPAFRVFAAEDMPRLVDMADLLSQDEEADLLGMLDEVSERQQVDLVVVTVDSTQGQEVMAYADDFYDYNGYGFGEERDGILLLISMEERDWWISTTGYGITAVTDAGREYMSERFITDLSEGDYGAAFTSFASLCDAFITQARTGEPYDVDNLPKEPFEAGINLVLCFGIGFIIALVATGIMRSQLKTVHRRSEADNYIADNGMQLTRKSDLFLYRQIDRRKKAENNNTTTPSSSGGGSSTHTSSSGTTHGGGGGKF